jgi:hypothetical protein
MDFDWNTFFFIILIGLLVLAFIYVLILFISSLAKRRKMGKAPSHIELYFDDNFRKIIDEWDLMPRDRVKDFKKDMNKRLSKVGADLGSLEKKRTSLEGRLSTVEKGLDKLEGF